MLLFNKTKTVTFFKTTKKYSFCGFIFLTKEKTSLLRRTTLFGRVIRFKDLTPPAPVFPAEARELSYSSHQPLKFSHKRLAVFASFSNNGQIADHVLYFLKNLAQLCDGIVFVADNPLLEEEFAKLKGLVIHAECKRHGEYDFGSYKRGFEYLRQNDLLRGVTELVICNDSCFGPVFPLAETWAQMKGKDCDFWGLTSSREFHRHIQSYFYVFKSQVFNHPFFANFLSRVRSHKIVQQVIIHYELKFSKLLEKQGFRSASLVPIEAEAKANRPVPNLTVYTDYLLSRYRFPLVKVKSFLPPLSQEFQDEYVGALEFIRRHNPKLYQMMQTYLKL